MDTYDIIIIGGGVGGLACGITLASAHAKPWFKERRILVIDDGSSDLKKAQLFNVPGVTPGTTGPQVLRTMWMQFQQYPPATLHAGCVCSAQRDGDHWTVRTSDDYAFAADAIVLATGYKRWELSGLPCEPQPHPRGGKSDRIMLDHDGVYTVAPTLHVAGLLAGGSSQFAIAAGIGAQVAVEILSVWAGKRTHIHDLPETPQ
jgi:glycine/D-amino acid oxidase-like deaminating enzyme